MEKFIKPFTAISKEKLQSGVRVVSFASWDRLMPALKQAANVKPDEIISGVIVTPEGIEIVVDKK